MIVKMVSETELSISLLPNIIMSQASHSPLNLTSIYSLTLGTWIEKKKLLDLPVKTLDGRSTMYHTKYVVKSCPNKNISSLMKLTFDAHGL